MVEPDRRVAPFLGRVLDESGSPAGTCFQVRSGVLVTAWHVLDALDAGSAGDMVAVDPLRGGPSRQARVERTDPVHDLAVLSTGEPLPGWVGGLSASDEMAMSVPVVIIGVPVIDDPGHSYRFLEAEGRWGGGTTRDDQVPLGRVVASAVMRGMSGAPVLAGDVVAGVVSARYNSIDGWGRDSVWVARTEDLMPLLAGLGDVRIAHRDGTAGAKTEMFAVVDAMLRLESIADEGARREVLRQLPADIAGAIPHHAVPRVQVLAMLRTCLGYPDGLRELLDAIRFVEQDSDAMRQLDATAARVFPGLLG
jgi:hypothetical protein